MAGRTVTDHLDRTVEYPYPPKRIVSLVPGITDTLFSLGLGNRVAGRTRFCVHPQGEVEGIPRVAGTKDLNLEKIRNVRPELILAEKEENTKEMVEQLEKEFPVYVFEIRSVHDAYNMINDLGDITGTSEKAETLIADIQAGFSRLPDFRGKRFAYCIWKKPYMVVGGDTYIQSVFERMGLVSAFSGFGDRYPSVTEEDFQMAGLDYLFLSTEPFPFNEEHVRKFASILPDVNVMLLNGEMLWYGPRMLEAAEYFSRVFMRV